MENARSREGESIGNYRLVRAIGRGSTGTVYIGEHAMIGQRVAIKVLHDDLARDGEVVRRMFVEARAASAVKHDNIVDVLDFGERRDDDGHRIIHITMPLYSGESLSARLARGPLSLDEAAHIVDQAARALSACHAAGVIHRDITPDHIFLTRRGCDRRFVKLLDFGAARQKTVSMQITQPGALVGTPEYMAPEQCAARPVDGRADVYALGIVLYQMLTGRLPFSKWSAAETIAAQLDEPPPPPSRYRPIPAEVEAVILRCLQKAPDARFPSMDAFRAALRVAITRSEQPRVKPERRHRRALIFALVGAAVGAVASCALLLNHI